MWRRKSPYPMEDDWVFASPASSDKLPYWSFSIFRTYVKPALKEAKITSKVGWHTFRHPVDFEQREGRISRYAGLGVRRSLAAAHGQTQVEPWQSPFKAIFDAARESKVDDLGIERWWSSEIEGEVLNRSSVQSSIQ